MLKWITGGIVSFFAGRYLLRLNKASNNIITQTKLAVNKVSLSGIEIQAKVHLQNPTDVKIILEFPFINLTHQGNFVGSSVTKNEVITLEAKSEYSFEITIRSAGWFTLVQSLGTSLVQQIRTGQQVILELMATTTSKVNGLPYKKEESIKLKI